MTNLLTNGSAVSIAELSMDELDLVGGGEATTRMVIECKIDENGNGQCVIEVSEKED